MTLSFYSEQTLSETNVINSNNTLDVEVILYSHCFKM